MVEDSGEEIVRDFTTFTDHFRAKSKQISRINQKLVKRRKELIIKANGDPSFAQSDEFFQSMQNISNRERRIHRICEAGLEQAKEYIKTIDVELRAKSKSKEYLNYLERYLNNLIIIFSYLDKRLKKTDKRLKLEEHFLQTRSKRHLIKFLKSYNKELKEDLRLLDEMNVFKADTSRIENTLAYRLKQLGITFVVGAAIPASVPLALPLKVAELIIRPITYFIIDIVVVIFGGEEGDARKAVRGSNDTFVKKLKFELVDTMPIINELIGKLNQIKWKNPQRNTLLDGLKVNF